MAQDEINISAIQSMMVSLIGHFQDAGDLISEQIKAVVHQNFDELTELIEQQVNKNTMIAELEKDFKQEIVEAFGTLGVQPPSYSITELIPYCDDVAEECAELRDDLKAAIETTQQKQHHLVQLLEFAQEHIAQTLKDIFAAANQHGMHYKQSGEKSSGEGNSRMINRTI